MSETKSTFFFTFPETSGRDFGKSYHKKFLNMANKTSSSIDYSKWDHIEDSDDEHEEGAPPPPMTLQQQLQHEKLLKENEKANTALLEDGRLQVPSDSNSGFSTKKGTEEGRYRFEYEGRLIYEWEQNLDEVNIYVVAPPNVKAAQIDCGIQSEHVRLGIIGADRYFLDERTFSKVVVAESSWFLADGVIQIVLSKAHRGLTWESALMGHHGKGIVDPFTKQNIQKDMMIERFQEEHPGFDFRGADFNGTVPDPRTFMGGIGYK